MRVALLLLLLRRSTKLLRQGPKLLRRPLSYCCWSGGRLLRWSRDLLRSLWKSRKLLWLGLNLSWSCLLHRLLLLLLRGKLLGLWPTRTLLRLELLGLGLSW